MKSIVLLSVVALGVPLCLSVDAPRETAPGVQVLAQGGVPPTCKPPCKWIPKDKSCVCGGK
jgi:hypothetical protein